MARWIGLAALAAVVAAADCPGEEEGDVYVSILDLAPVVSHESGKAATLRWRLVADGPAYYSVTVGSGGRVLASGRKLGAGDYETEISATDLEPCLNPVVLSAAAPGGGAASDSTEVYLCPTFGCTGCADGTDADSDVDVDIDTDVDTDVDTDTDADADQTCDEFETFPNGGECDPVGNRCCGPGETCMPDASGSWTETCIGPAGTVERGGYCNYVNACREGLTCFANECVSYCTLERGYLDCPDGMICYFFAIDGYWCVSYGVCNYDGW